MKYENFYKRGFQIYKVDSFEKEEIQVGGKRFSFKEIKILGLRFNEKKQYLEIQKILKVSASTISKAVKKVTDVFPNIKQGHRHLHLLL